MQKIKVYAVVTFNGGSYKASTNAPGFSHLSAAGNTKAAAVERLRQKIAEIAIEITDRM